MTTVRVWRRRLAVVGGVLGVGGLLAVLVASAFEPLVSPATILGACVMVLGSDALATRVRLPIVVSDSDLLRPGDVARRALVMLVPSAVAAAVILGIAYFLEASVAGVTPLY